MLAKAVIIVCHGGVIDVAIRQAARSPARGQFDLWTLNTSLTEFAVDDRSDKMAFADTNSI